MLIPLCILGQVAARPKPRVESTGMFAEIPAAQGTHVRFGDDSSLDAPTCPREDRQLGASMPENREATCPRQDCAPVPSTSVLDESMCPRGFSGPVPNNGAAENAEAAKTMTDDGDQKIAGELAREIVEDALSHTVKMIRLIFLQLCNNYGT